MKRSVRANVCTDEGDGGATEGDGLVSPVRKDAPEEMGPDA